MAKITNKLKHKLHGVIKEEYEGCDFFMAASNILTNHIKDISELIDKKDTGFDNLRDEICEIGIYINNVEKRLLEVEECYTKLIEILADEKKDA